MKAIQIKNKIGYKHKRMKFHLQKIKAIKREIALLEIDLHAKKEIEKLYK